MAPYFPLYVSRSDGKLDVLSSKTKKIERNEPTTSQLNDTPDSKGISDFYKRLEIGDAKEVDWRRKLGGMLMRELGEKEHLGNSGTINSSLRPLTYIHRQKLHSCSLTGKLSAVRTREVYNFRDYWRVTETNEKSCEGS